MLGVLCWTLASCSADPGYQGRTSADWIRQLSDTSANARVDAVLALGNVLRINPESRIVVEALARALGDSIDEVRLTAGDALTQFGVQSPVAVPGLLGALADTVHPEVRSQAAGILGRLGSAARAAVPALTNALRDSAADVRANAAESPGLVGPDAAAAIPGSCVYRWTAAIRYA